jgi:hypothetical protein
LSLRADGFILDGGMMKQLCAIAVMTGALTFQPGMAHAAPEVRWPSFDDDRLQQIVDAFARHGVTVCPDDVRTTKDITGSPAHQALDLYASARRSSCPQHRSADDPAYDPDEERATYASEAFLDIAFYRSQESFDRGVKTWERRRLHWPIVGWSWKPVVLGLTAGYEDVVEATLKAMKALPGQPKVLFDNS